MNTWEIEHAHRIGKEVQRLRKVAGLTAQQLGDRAAELGLKMTRQAISDLENGRRRYVTTAELIIFAAALNTSPVNLVYPGPYDADVEVVPSSEDIEEFQAAQWFSGLDTYLRGDELDPEVGDRGGEYDAWVANTDLLAGWRTLDNLIAARDELKDEADTTLIINGDREAYDAERQKLFERVAFMDRQIKDMRERLRHA